MKNWFKGIAAVFIGAIGLLGFQLHQWQQKQREKIEATPKLLQAIGEVKTSQNLPDLQQQKIQLRETELALQQVPDWPGFDYTGAQAQLKQLRPVLNAVDTRANRLSQVDTAIQDALILDAEALELAQNPPHPADRLTQAVAKWKDAIQYLSDIPKTHPTYAQAQVGIPAVKEKLTQAEKWLTQEKLGVRKMEAAFKATEEAIKLVPFGVPVQGKVLKNAQAKLQQSVKFLKEIPAGTTVSEDVEKFLPIAEDNLARMNRTVAELKSCLGDLKSTTCIAQTPPRIDEFPVPQAVTTAGVPVPPAAVAASTMTRTTSQPISRYRSYTRSRFPSVPPVHMPPSIPRPSTVGQDSFDGDGSSGRSRAGSSSGGRSRGFGGGRSGGGG